jgi:predicted TPR repeat methyltransferase
MSDDAGWLAAGSSSTDEVRAYYEALASEYDATLERWGYTAPDHAAELTLAALGDATSAAHVLDAGCGTGLVGAALRRAGFGGRLTGVDVSAASIDVAAERKVYGTLDVADLQQALDSGDDAYDAVVCVGVLTYLPDLLRVWGEFCRVVRPGGVVVCTHRDDLWRARRADEALHTLEGDGRWTITHLSEARPYLPQHTDFGDAILVRFLVGRVR